MDLVTIPVIVGYVTLGVGVIVGRAVCDAVRAGWARRRSCADEPPEAPVGRAA